MLVQAYMEARFLRSYFAMSANRTVERSAGPLTTRTIQGRQQEDDMQLDRCSRRCLMAALACSMLAVAAGVVSAALGAPGGLVVMAEASGLACVVAFTLLIWAAIQDGKQHDSAAVRY